MMRLDAATFMLQWATGGLFFLWVTTRRREVGIGYGWLMRATFLIFAVIAVAVGVRYDFVPVREAASVGVVLASGYALWVSFVRRKAGVAGQREEHDRRSARVTEMTGIDREVQSFDSSVPEFPPVLDLIAPAIGLVGLVAGGVHAGSPVWLTVARVVAGAAFLGAVTDAMLLGHWYLVQPGLKLSLIHI